MDDLCDTTGSGQRYRILSLDGGGVKGTYTASVLCTLEALTGETISEHFDLVTGTSTGGIIAIAIGLGIPLSAVLELYEKQGPKIFPCPGAGIRGKLTSCWRHLLRPKHSHDVLRQAISGVLGERLLGESRNRLVIPAFNAVNGDIQLFKTAHCPAFRMDYRIPAVDVAMATSAAPTYFNAHADECGRVFLDGGVWANSPVMVGIVEAITALGWPLERLDVLSVGTTAEPFDVGRKRRTGGLFQWNSGLVDLLMAAQVKGMLGLAGALTKHRILRIDVTTRPGRFSLDNSLEISELKALGENSARQQVDEIFERFMTSTAPAFEPCHQIDAGETYSLKTSA